MQHEDIKATFPALLFSFKGRIGAGAFFVSHIIKWLIFIGMIRGATTLFESLSRKYGYVEMWRANQPVFNPFAAALTATQLIAAALFIWITLATSKKRLNDGMNISPWGMLWFLFPPTWLVGWLFLVFIRSDENLNRHGARQTLTGPRVTTT